MSVTTRLALLVVTGWAHADAGVPDDRPLDSFLVPDGAVHALAVADGRVYIGGEFTYVGPASGGGAIFGDRTQAPRPEFPQANGPIHAACSDGNGGWFIGGDFDRVAGHSVANLAHVNSDFTLDTTWSLSPNGVVNALTVSESNLIVGGSFSRIGSEFRTALAAIDLNTKRVLPWDFGIESDTRFRQPSVDILRTRDRQLYFAGFFARASGEVRRNLASIDLSTGKLQSWNPMLGGANPSLSSMELGATKLYLAGDFETVQNQPNPRLAAVDLKTGSPLEWSPIPDGPVNALAVRGDLLLVGGSFSNIAGESRAKAAAFDLETGHLRWWKLAAVEGYAITEFGIGEQNLYVVYDEYIPSFYLDEVARPYSELVAYDFATGERLRAQPNIGGDISSIAVANGDVLVGGWISIGGAKRFGIAALDSATGQLTDWNPALDGPVSAMAVHNGELLIGGRFTKVDGQARSLLAMVDRTTGAVKDWNPVVASNRLAGIRQIVVQGDTAFVGGKFDTINGKSRHSLAAFDLETGDLNSWNPEASWRGGTPTIYGIGVNEDRVYVTGTFDTIGAGPRLFVAAVDSVTGLAAPWSSASNYPEYPQSLAVSPHGLLVAGSARSVPGAQIDGVVRLDLETGAVIESWRPDVQSADAIAVSDSHAFVAGSWSSGSYALRAVSLAEGTGSWSLVERRHSAYFMQNKPLIEITDRRLYYAGSFDSINGEYRPFLAVFDFSEDVTDRLRIGAPRFTSGGSFQFTLESPSFRPVRIEVSDDLKSWRRLETKTSDGTVTITSTGRGSQFYRAIAE